jgi:DNA mismatch repair protein MSH6
MLGFSSRLRTLLTQLRPEEVVLPRDALSETTWAVLRKDLPLHTWEKRNLLKPGVEFWAAATTVDELTKGEYFQKPNESELQWPTTLQSLIGKLSEPAVADASNGAELTLSALGAAVWYLRRVLLDTELVSLGNFALFDPAQPARDAECLLLDGSTLANLEILLNQDGTASGSLLSLIDRTSTAFGKRLFRQWLTVSFSHPKTFH